MTRGGAEGPSSSAPKVRPSTGRTPSASKKPLLTRSPETRSGPPEVTTVNPARTSYAPRDWKAPLARVRQARKSRYETDSLVREAAASGRAPNTVTRRDG